MKKFVTAAFLSVVLGSLSQVAVSQTSKGILAGTVRDSSGAALPNANVTVISEDTGESRTLHASGIGAYRVEGINPGLYEIKVDASGFAAADVTGIRVNPSVVTSYDPVLGLGSTTATVTVEANTNSINTETGGLSATIGSRELTDVPIFSLNPFELVANLPGAQAVNANLNLGGVAGNYEQVIVNGARPRSNNFMLDGQDINDVGIGGQSFNPQVPDMYQSTTALLNSASAEYGRSGGAVINLVTKAGTNKFHGSVWELYSGSGLNALDGVTRQGKPFPAGSPNPKARYDQHQYGFTLGGPIWREKLFGFGGTQFTRFYGKSFSDSIKLPDAAGYAELTAIGKTSATAGTQVALLQGLLNSGSYLNSYTQVNSAAALKVSAGSCPGGVACTVTMGVFQRPPVSQLEPDTQWMYRVDFIPHTTDTFSYRYIHDRQTFSPDLALNDSGLPGFDGEVGGPTELGQGTWTHVFTPNLLNEFRASEVRLASLFTPTAETVANPLSKSFNITLSGSGMPTLGVSQNIPQGRTQEMYQFQDTVGWTKGRHSLRIGADIGRDLEKDLVAQNALGGLTFAAGGGASSLDNFLLNRLGTSGSASRSFGPTRVDPHLWKIAAFVQDDVKLSSELTINLGLRYDYDTMPDNALPYPAVDVSNPFQPINTVVRVKEDRNNFGPRFGFAYNPHEGIFADGKTVFHGGIGVFYDTDFTNILVNSAQSSPNAPTGTATSSAVGGLTNATGQLASITPALTPTSSVQSVANNLRNPLSYQYNFGIERALPAALKLTVNYVGARGEHLFSNRQLNYFQGIGLPRINSSRGIINIRDNRADSNYNSVQVEASRSFSHGLGFTGAYTYGKDLDDSSEVFATFASPTSYSANLAGDKLGVDWGPSAWDRRHIASFVFDYRPAGFHSSNAGTDFLLEAFTRHFLLSGTAQIMSGVPSTFNFLGLDSNGDGSAANDRPLVGNTSKPITTAAIDGAWLSAFGVSGGQKGVYYDLTALNDPNGDVVVVSPSQVRFLIPYGAQAAPAVGRNSFQNPGQVYVNLAAEKQIPAKFTHLESAMFVMRVECQNVGNHNNVLGPLDLNLLDVGTVSYLNKSDAREGTYQAFRLWAKFVF